SPLSLHDALPILKKPVVLTHIIASFGQFFYSFPVFFSFCITFWTGCSIELFYLQPPLCYSLHPHYIASFFFNRFLKLLSLNHDHTSLLNMLLLVIMHLNKTQRCVKYTFRHL